VSHPKIQQYIEEQAARYAIGSIHVHHQMNGPVDRIYAVAGKNPGDLAQLVWKAMTDDAAAFPGQVNQYFMYFHKAVSDADPGDETEPIARKPIQVSSPDDADGDPNLARASEGPDEKGLVAQAMRHQETNMRTAERMTISSMADMQAMNARLWERIKQMQDREMETMMIARKALLDQGQLEMQREQMRQEAAVFQKLLQQLDLALPIGLAYLTKPKKGSEEEAKMREEIVSDPPFEMKLVLEFFQSLNPEQYTRLGSVLSILQRSALMELQQGNVPPELIPNMVSRIINDLSTEQLHDIDAILDGNPAQCEAFHALFNTRKHALNYQVTRELAQQKAADKNPNSDPVTEALKKTAS
jgi:hypothetical protein